MRKKHFLLLLILSIYPCLAVELPEYGLHIQTYPHGANEYTTMALEDGLPIRTEGKEFTLSFKLYARNANVFGTVCRLITDNGRNVDLMYSVIENDKRFPILVAGDAVYPTVREVKCGVWVDVSITIRPDGTVTLTYDHSTVNAKDDNLKNVQNLRISLGYCKFKGYTLADVASVNVKDVRLARDGKVFRFWKMSLHHNNDCYDELAHSVASGENARWIIDQYITWKPIYSKDYEMTPSVAFDSIHSTFYMATDKRTLYVYHPDSQQEDILPIKGGEYAANYPNQLIYLPESRQLLSYTLDENLYAAFNPDTQCWESTQAPVREHDYWNNTVSYNPKDKSLVSFGGYGHYRFNNELLVSRPFSRDSVTQQHTTLYGITPRYSASSAIEGETMYIFGGRGCPSGKQELSPRNYYDFYAVNLKTLETTKLWEVPQGKITNDFYGGENMLYDQKDDCFYLLTNLHGGTLMKISKREPHFEPMSLPINEELTAQYLYTNLYYAPGQGKLYAVILQSQVSGKTHVNIYSMDYPPVPVRSLEQAEVKNPGGGIGGKALFAAVILFIVAAGAVVARFLYRRKKKTVLAPQTPEVPHAYAHTTEEACEENTEETYSLHNYDFSRSYIRFFGGFRVMDKDGNDLTPQFTPTLKQLLILLILYTGKDDNGISGHRMLQQLWFDKTEESAKNNRGVYVSKLRSLMEKVGGVSIVSQNGFWSIQIAEGTLCDYLETLRLYKEDKSGNSDRLLELLLQGMMLPNMEADWIDAFKNEFSDRTIDQLCKLLRQTDLPDALKLKIADTMFKHDYLNEEALGVKCRILCKQGKKGLAKTVYDSFCKEYATSLGVAYPTPLMKMIESEV